MTFAERTPILALLHRILSRVGRVPTNERQPAASHAATVARAARRDAYARRARDREELRRLWMR
jgi:hypothetical protein